MGKKVVSGIMLSLLLIGMLTLAFNIQQAKASKPLAPNGVHNMTTYESRIGESGLLFEDDNIQMWMPTRYENHSRVIFDYLVAGYENMSRLFGDHDYPYKFSIEHYPPGSSYARGGTDIRGTVFYSYTNLEDNTPEWNNWGVPHMMGYYEEMAHCFIRIFLNVGFYEALGMMIGGFEVTLRAANNPYVELFVSTNYQKFATTTSYYLNHNSGPPGVADNIWQTRVLAHIFKTEVVDVYGWEALTNTFKFLKLKGYPLKQYDREHTWGGFLHYLGYLTNCDSNTIFANYGLPSIEWFEEDGYQNSVKQIDENQYSFRVKLFDSLGGQPRDVNLHVYSHQNSKYAMNFIGGNNETGWVFETNVTLTADYSYAFSANDDLYILFQAIGPATLMNTEAEVIPEFPLSSILGLFTVLSPIAVAVGRRYIKHEP